MYKLETWCNKCKRTRLLHKPRRQHLEGGAVIIAGNCPVCNKTLFIKKNVSQCLQAVREQKQERGKTDDR